MLKAADHAKAAGHLHTLKSFMSIPQMSILSENFRGEEGEYFAELVRDLDTTFNTMPKTYEQDGKGDEAIAHLHYFNGSMDWYITERDMENEQYQAFGIANIGFGFELGYISLIELADNNVELDLHFTPKTLKEIKAGI